MFDNRYRQRRWSPAEMRSVESRVDGGVQHFLSGSTFTRTFHLTVTTVGRFSTHSEMPYYSAKKLKLRLV